MSAIRTTCAYCGVGCGIEAKVTGPRSVTIRGDAGHPANRGRLCSKGTHLGETVAIEGRLLHPMIGGERKNWDEALDHVAARLRETIAEHGPGSVAFYVSGQLLSEDYYVANKLMKGFIGSGNIDTNSRLCMASAVAAHNRAFGEDVVPCSYDDLDRADLILLVGSNTAWCHPVVWQRIEAARASRGTRIVVIDPRRTETAEQADLHVPIAPDGDVALFNALLAALRERGLASPAEAEVPAGFWAALPCDPGVPADIFAQLVDLVSAHPHMVTLFSQGANQSRCGTDKGNAIINLHLATGRIGFAGAGPFSITGQPNAMGGREVGGLANTLACHLGFADDERAAVAAYWGVPEVCPGPGLKAVDMFRAVHEGRIRFLWVMATNPAVSMPDSAFVREALARCETLVVSEAIADTDTARLAHVLLPAQAWGEKDGTVTNSERRISRQRALFPAPGEARADWRNMADVAARLGWAAQFDWADPAAIFAEYAAMTALAVERGKALDLRALAGLDAASYDGLEPFQWGGPSPLASGCATPSRRPRLVAVTPPSPRPVDPAFPLALNTARYRDQWHTMTRTGWSATLAQHRREPLLEINAHDASARGLGDGDLAEVRTPFGAAVFRVSVTDAQAQGAVCVPMHWSDVMASGGRANRLPGQAVDPVSGQPAFKDNAAQVVAIRPAWRAFLASVEPLAPEGLVWWSRSRIEGGWLHELAGNGACDEAALLPESRHPDVRRLEASDAARGMKRVVVRSTEGRVVAALFVTRTGTLPPREWIARQLGRDSAQSAELLAARPATPAEDFGPIVCVCLGVGARTIAAALAGGAASVAAVGAACGAGTNCGSCRPAIARMLRAAPARDRALAAGACSPDQLAQEAGEEAA